MGSRDGGHGLCAKCIAAGIVASYPRVSYAYGCSTIWAGQKRKLFDRLEHLASTRAYENRNYFVLCNRVGTEGEKVHGGQSAVAGPDEQIISASGNEEECIVYVTLRRDRILEERAYLPVFRDRRPELYGILCKPL